MDRASTIVWNAFPEKTPASVFFATEIDAKVPYFVVFAGNQVTILIWHSKQGSLGKWEWSCGKSFHGDVLFYADQPIFP